MNKIYQKFFSCYKKAGFTLIELLVVVLIIGILAAIAVPQYEKAVVRSKFMQLVTAGKALAQAQQVFYLANGTYAEKFEDLDISFDKQDYIASDRVMFSNGHCYFSNSQEAIVCAMTKNSQRYASLLTYYDGKKYTCCSYGTNNFEADSLCRQLTNKSYWSEGCLADQGDAGSCHCFTVR